MVAFNETDCYRHNYKARIVTRAHFLAPDSRELVGEFFAASVHVAFSDILGFFMEVKSDNGRHYQQVYSSEPANDRTDWPVAGQRVFRHTFDLVAREGLIGTFFVFTFQKVIPDTGIFDHFGVDLEIFPCPDYPPEFEQGLGALTRDYS